MIRVHCDGIDCDHERVPDSRQIAMNVNAKPLGPRWLSLKRGEVLFDFCSSACLAAWASSQGMLGSKELGDGLDERQGAGPRAVQ